MGGGASLMVPMKFSMVTEKTVALVNDISMGGGASLMVPMKFSMVTEKIVESGVSAHTCSSSQKLPEQDKHLVDLNSGEKDVAKWVTRELFEGVQHGEDNIL
ncbi:hypothetical protein LINPERPRIM_LOCUS1064 [Linum perenne]